MNLLVSSQAPPIQNWDMLDKSVFHETLESRSKNGI